MPIYEYACWDCTGDESERKNWFVLNIEHKMSETPEFVCPICEGNNVEKIISIPGAVYVRGNGYLDKEGTHRDMNRHKLRTDDPYAHMRQPGEAEELDKKLKNQGKFNQGRTPTKFKPPEIDDDTDGRWDAEQKKVIWRNEEVKKEKEVEPNRPEGLPSWLPNIE